jgi:hypothetical protein
VGSWATSKPLPALGSRTMSEGMGAARIRATAARSRGVENCCHSICSSLLTVCVGSRSSSTAACSTSSCATCKRSVLRFRIASASASSSTSKLSRWVQRPSASEPPKAVVIASLSKARVILSWPSRLGTSRIAAAVQHDARSRAASNRSFMGISWLCGCTTQLTRPVPLPSMLRF